MAAASGTVACVAENRPDWYRRVETLALSLRNFGGQLADAHFTAHFLDGVDEGESQLLAEVGVRRKAALRYSERHLTTNKIRMFEDFAGEPDADYLYAFDCDTVVVGDLTREIVPGHVMARPAALSPMTTPVWLELLASLGLPPAATPVKMLGTGQEVPAPYLNSGVVIVPAEHAAPLATAWKTYLEQFMAAAADGVDEPWTGYFLDQIALTCALVAAEIPVQVLSPYVNLPTAVRLRRRLPRDRDLAISVLHYHKHIAADGQLLPTDAPVVNALIERVNRVIAARTPRGPSEALAEGAAQAHAAAGDG